MRVLMINVVCGIRSTGRICTDLAEALEAQGHEVKIAYGRESVPEKYQKYAVKIGTDLGIKIHGLKARLLDGAGFGSKKATESFIEWVKLYDPDVIHLHNIHGYYIHIPTLFYYLKSSKKKVIWTLHDCWAFTGHSAYCDAVNCNRWRTGCHDCPQKHEYPKALIDRSKENWIKKKKTFCGVGNLTIVTPSEWLAKLVRQSFLREYPTNIIHNGIDTGQFKPLKNDFKEYYNIENKTILLGVATSWNDMKGYSDFIKLSNLVEDSFKIVMVGLTDEQLKKLPSNILGIKRTASEKELAYIYSASDYLLNLSYCENYPTNNLEARACGIKVITYNTGGSPESAGHDAIIVNRGDVDSIAQLLKTMDAKPTSATPITEIDNKHSINQYNDLYQYEDALHKNGGVLES